MGFRGEGVGFKRRRLQLHPGCALSISYHISCYSLGVICFYRAGIGFCVAKQRAGNGSLDQGAVQGAFDSQRKTSLLNTEGYTHEQLSATVRVDIENGRHSSSGDTPCNQRPQHSYHRLLWKAFEVAQLLYSGFVSDRRHCLFGGMT